MRRNSLALVAMVCLMVGLAVLACAEEPQYLWVGRLPSLRQLGRDIVQMPEIACFFKDAEEKLLEWLPSIDLQANSADELAKEVLFAQRIRDGRPSEWLFWRDGTFIGATRFAFDGILGCLFQRMGPRSPFSERREADPPPVPRMAGSDWQVRFNGGAVWTLGRQILDEFLNQQACRQEERCRRIRNRLWKKWLRLKKNGQAETGLDFAA